MIFPSINIVPMGESTHVVTLTKVSDPPQIKYKLDGEGYMEWDPSTNIKSHEALQVVWRENQLAGFSSDEARRWMPLGKYGFKHMFWVKYVPSTNQTKFHWTDDEKKLLEIYEMSRFDYVKPVCLDMDESIYLFGQFHRPNADTRCRIYTNTHRRNSRDLKRAVGVLGPNSRVAVFQDPVDPHVYHVKFSLHDEKTNNTWHRYDMVMSDGKFKRGSGSIVSSIILSRFQYPYHQLDYTTDLYELNLPDAWGMWDTWNKPPPANSTTVWKGTNGTTTVWKGSSRNYYFYNVLSISSDIFEDAKPGFIPVHALTGNGGGPQCWVKWDHRCENLIISS